MSFKNNVFLFLLAIVLPNGLSGQSGWEKDSLSAILLNFSYGLQAPGADLGELYGYNNKINVTIDYSFPRSSWGLSFGADYFFGREVKTDVLNNLRTQSGYLIGTDGLPADVFLRERGFNLNWSISFTKDILKGRNSFGPYLSLGGGVLSHWIRIQDERTTADQLKRGYDKGYDRRRLGFSFHQFIGLQYLSHNKRINFVAGFDFIQGFTQSVRPYNFDTKSYNEGRNTDLLNGFKIGWILPFYFNESTEEIYY